jgi:hypothetical protein
MQGGEPDPRLAIRPYPDEYIRHVALADGTPLTLREFCTLCKAQGVLPRLPPGQGERRLPHTCRLGLL